jgi:hypothetical protein
MPFPIRKCVVCGEAFELKPDKPGFANRCPECSVAEEDASTQEAAETASREQNAERRKAIRDLLYRKDS